MRKEKSNIYLKSGIVILAIALIIVIAFVLFKGNSSSSKHVVITAANLYSQDISTGRTYAIGTDKGADMSNYSTGYFTYSIACSGGGSQRIDSFQISPSIFTFRNVSPSLPIILPCNNQSTSFTVFFTVPNTNYVGTIQITDSYNQYYG